MRRLAEECRRETSLFSRTRGGLPWELVQLDWLALIGNYLREEGKWVEVSLEIKRRSLIGCPRALLMKPAAWTVHTKGHVARTHFCLCNLLQEFKSIWIHALSLGDKILSPRPSLSLVREVGFDPGSCIGTWFSCVLTLIFPLVLHQIFLTLLQYWDRNQNDTTSMSMECCMRLIVRSSVWNTSSGVLSSL